MNDVDSRLWRALFRAWVVLTLGVLGLLLGLEARPQQGASVFGVLILALAVQPVGTAIWRLPAPVRNALRRLPRYRPMMSVTAALLTAVAILVLCWTINNLLFPGTLAPLSLALVGALASGVTTLLGRRISIRN